MAQATRNRKTAADSNGWADDAGSWAGRKLHNVVLPSGAKVTVQAADLSSLALANLVPEDLAHIARQEFEHPGGASGALAESLAGLSESEEDMARAREATQTFAKMIRWLVAEHIVVAPKITVDELMDEKFPIEDLDWLYGFAVRRQDEDALGRRIGVARLDDFATFREEHGCGPDCEACDRVIGAFSTADVGAL